MVMVLPVFLKVFLRKKRDASHVNRAFFMLCGGFLAVAAWKNQKLACGLQSKYIGCEPRGTAHVKNQSDRVNLRK